MEDRVMIIGVNHDNTDMEEDIKELKRLVETAGGEVIESIEVKVKRLNPATLIGKGKLEEIKNISQMLDINLLIFSMPLSPVQKRNIEDTVDIRVIDRNELIMDIFALHARTKISRLEVELAQLEYNLTHLTGKGIEMSRTGGGIGTRGPGEQKIEVDRRHIRRRISKIKKELKDIDRHRKITTQKRSRFFRVSLAGYTNSGKSTLLRRLTGKDVYVADKLFATLDTSSAKIEGDIIISDTVGFIRNLPPMLLKSFKTTLQEIVESNLILIVLDASSKSFYQHYNTVIETLKEIGAEDIGKLTVFNKIDLIKDESFLDALKQRFPDAIFISALRGINIDELLKRIFEEKEKWGKKLHLFIPYDRGNVRNRLYKSSVILKEEEKDEGWEIVAIVSYHFISEFDRYATES